MARQQEEQGKVSWMLSFRRRNQIAHEADMNYVTNTKNAIILTDVVDAKEFLVDLSQHIDSLT